MGQCSNCLQELNRLNRNSSPWCPWAGLERWVDEAGLILKIMASAKLSVLLDKKTPHWSVDFHSQILTHVGSILIVHCDFVKGMLNALR